MPTSTGIRNLLVAVYVLSSFIRGWGIDDWKWSVVKLLFGLGALLEVVWPEAGTRPKPIKISMGAMLVVGMALIAGGAWRNVVSSARPAAEGFVMIPMSATPAEGRQGQVLDVNISATDATFPDGSVINFGPGIDVVMTQRMDATTLLARIQIAIEVPVGYRRIWVSRPGSKNAIDDSPFGAFQVIAAVPGGK